MTTEETGQKKTGEEPEKKQHVTDGPYLVPIHMKYSLTVSQAAEYFGIGEKKLRQIIDANFSADFLLHNGTRTTIKRKKFEQFLDRTSSI